jgi:hypothetical protein
VTRRFARLAVAMLLVAALTPVAAGPALAECFPRSSAAARPYDVKVAFTATVRSLVLDADEQALAAGEGDGSAWTLVLDVDHLYRGDMDTATVTWIGHTLRHLSCQTDLLGEELEAGQRLFIALEPFGGQSGAASPAGRMLVWTRIDGSWSFDDAALQDEYGGGEPYPDAARDVHTTAEILALIDRLPDTATAPTVAPAGAPDDAGVGLGTQVGLLLLAFALSLLRIAGVTRR